MNNLKTISNFRDLGGIKTKNNETIQPHKLLRSGELCNVSEEDKALLQTKYQLRSVMDLRSADETAAKPDDFIDGSRYLHIDVMKDFTQTNTGLEDLIRRAHSGAVDEEMTQVYQQLALNKSAQIGFRQIVQEAASLDTGACLFHCFAGKDRTGIAAAILLELLEVNRDDIFEDYLKTNLLRAPANKIICNEAAARGVPPAALNLLQQLLEVKEIYLQKVYDTAEDNFGSFENYITTALGITSDLKENLKYRCLK